MYTLHNKSKGEVNLALNILKQSVSLRDKIYVFVHRNVLKIKNINSKE